MAMGVGAETRPRLLSMLMNGPDRVLLDLGESRA